ncbi:MAG: phage tail tape measure protein [Cellvibrionaceae bacterium]
MSSKAIQQIYFIAELADKVSGPADKITGKLHNMTTLATDGFKSVVAGGAGLIGVSYALNALLSPAREMNRVLGEVESLEVHNDALKHLEKTALSFSTRYGESAQDFVRSSYDIQSAIGGLVNDELAVFTLASNVLAKGTKADAATITDYMGTMYGIFKNSADKMGKAQWVEMLTGQTAAAVQMFKTDGSKMSTAFKSIGADATTHGIAINEQIAILGKLQTTMGGGEAGTKYRAFLSGAFKAQDALGLKFTDSNDRLLPMIDILNAIRGKFGDLDKASDLNVIEKAFGTKEALGLITLLSADTQGLADNINQLGNVKGMEKALKMADAMTDPLDRWSAGINAVTVKIGRGMLPVLDPLLVSLTEGADNILRWTELFPNLTSMFSKAILTLFGLIAVISSFAVVAGLTKLAIAGWHGLTIIAIAVQKIFAFTVGASRVALFLFQLSLFLGGVALSSLAAGTMAAGAAVWTFTAALLANPITWVVIGVVALIAALVALVVYWDEVTAAVHKFGTMAIDWIVKKWKWFEDVIGNNQFLSAVFAPFQLGIDAVKAYFHFAGKGIDWLMSKINLIPGIDIGGSTNAGVDIEGKLAAERESIRVAAPSLQSNNLSSLPVGGLQQKITNANSQKSMHIEKVEMNTVSPTDAFDFFDNLEMAAG